MRRRLRPRRSWSRGAPAVPQPLVFLAVDRVRYPDLDEALRRDLAWDSILEEKEELNLDPHQTAGRDPVEGGRRHGDGASAGGLPEAAGSGAGEARCPRRLAGHPSDRRGPLAERAGKRLAQRGAAGHGPRGDDPAKH